MDTPAAKRRRLNAATLSKPFRSPLKGPSTNSEHTRDVTPSLRRSVLVAEGTSEQNASKISNCHQALPLVAKLTPQERAKTVLHSPSITAALHSDPDIAPLIKAQRELEKQLRALKEELDEAQQARKIERDSTKTDPNGKIDGELKILKDKWRKASRTAAEDLFTGVRDRVNRIGGPKAWKEMQQKQMAFQNGFDEEPLRQPQRDSDDDEANDGEGGNRYAEYVEPESANEIEARGGNEIDEDGDDEEFTMSMMLRTLNVPLDVIGYDRSQQCWAD